MNDDVFTDIDRRLTALERTRPVLRVGEVTDTGPVDVALGGADVSYEDVAVLGGPALTTGDRVAALVWGSDLLVLGAIPGLRIVRGIVSAAGAITAGAEFTATRNAAGDYTVTFDPVFSAVPAVIVTAGETSGSLAAKLFSGTAPTASAARVFTFPTNTGVGFDCIFHFVAVGPA